MKIKGYLKNTANSMFNGKIYVAFLNARVLKQLVSAYWYDFKRFYKNSSIFFTNTEKNRPISARSAEEIEAKLLFNVHKIEKGLSNNVLKYGFGESVVREICILLSESKKHEVSENIVKYSIATLTEYNRIHKKNNQRHVFEDDILFNHFISDVDGECEGKVGFDTIEYTCTEKDYLSVVNSRVSCREFSINKVGKDRIKEVIQSSLKTPSVCNRQLWKVRYFEGRDCKEILSMQNGNATFSEYINEVLLVSVDMRGLLTPFERNQGYIDGGLFSMSVINALHYYDIGACALNWASSIKQNISIYEKKIVPEHEIVIMAIAIGNYPAKFKYPVSVRKPVEEVFLSCLK